MTRIKICGIRQLDDALAALEAGADMLGFVFAESRRRIDLELAREIIQCCRSAFPPLRRDWTAVGVFANQPLDHVRHVALESELDAIQLSGEESARYCRRLPLPLFKTVHVPPQEGGPFRKSDLDAELLRRSLDATRESCGAAMIILDTRRGGSWGGTGDTFDWLAVGTAARECMVAGGLSPSNVSSAIRLLAPLGVDVSSGVEEHGGKSVPLIRKFVEEVRKCDAHANS